jgi:hypothetical protein
LEAALAGNTRPGVSGFFDAAEFRTATGEMEMISMTKSTDARMQHRGFRFQVACIGVFSVLALLLAGPVSARETGRFHFSAIGDVVGEDEANNRLKKNNNVLWGSYPPGMALDISYFQAVNFQNGSGSDCFPDGVYSGPFVVSQENDGSALVDFYFVASGTDGSTDHKYVLHLLGTFDDPGNFPPITGTPIVMSAPAWMMTTEGKGQARKVTCTGDGDAGFVATVTVTRLW